jgi:hypothetical protein
MLGGKVVAGRNNLPGNGLAFDAHIRRDCRDSTATLQPVPRGQSAVCVARSGVGDAGAVAIEHLTGPPPGEPHEVGLRAAGGKPCVGEAVAEHVWMNAQSDRCAAAFEHLLDAGDGQFALPAEPRFGDFAYG